MIFFATMVFISDLIRVSVSNSSWGFEWRGGFVVFLGFEEGRNDGLRRR
jgi:hypothetical protein